MKRSVGLAVIQMFEAVSRFSSVQCDDDDDYCPSSLLLSASPWRQGRDSDPF